MANERKDGISNRILLDPLRESFDTVAIATVSTVGGIIRVQMRF